MLTWLSMSLHPRPLPDIIFDLAQFAFPRGGFFIEAGAHDGVTNSNTCLLPEKSWRGLLVEPAPSLYAALKENRPDQILANCALVSDESLSEISGTFADGSLMGSAHPSLKKRDGARPRNLLEKVDLIVRSRLHLQPRIRLLTVRAATLDSLVRQHQITEISFMVLDVEGFEIEALRGFSFEPRPALVIIETRLSDFAEIAELMLSRGYVIAANLSNFSPELHSGFSGDHQDYAWVDRNRPEILKAVSETPLFAPSN